MYKSVDELRAMYERSGGTFFSATNRKLFGSRWGNKVYGGRYFITSEIDKPRITRRYTIRMITDDGDIENVSTFLHYQTHSGARLAVLQMLKNGETA